MLLVNIKALSLCSILGYTLWGMTYAVCAMIAVGISPLEVLSMGVVNLLACLVIFCCGGVLVVSGLLFLYYLLSIMFPHERLWGEAAFVILGGLIVIVILALPSPAGQTFEALLFLWLFFCLPAFYTVLCLRGWEWYRRRESAEGESENCA